MNGNKKIPSTLDEYFLNELYEARDKAEEVQKLLDSTKSDLRKVLYFLKELRFEKFESPAGLSKSGYYEVRFVTSKPVLKKNGSLVQTDEEVAYDMVMRLIKREFGEQ